MLRRLIGENITLEFKAAGQPLWISADSGMIEQVVINLVVNARDAMPKGGRITLTTQVTHLDPSCHSRNPESRPGHFVCLTVSDTGCGMDDNTLKRIFEPFFTTKETGKGTGLGLATVYGIAQRHEGWIEVQSQIDLGTTFRVFLPASPAGATTTPSSPAPHPVRGGHESILLVEDDPAVRDQVATVLQRAGYHVFKAPNGQVAATLWSENRGAIDLLLTDMIMPEGLTGLELAQNLRQQHPRLKVIIMSGYNLEFALQGIPTKDQIHYLSKPFETSQLAQLVRRCLDAG
jgi:CheY-like chemotaxis protein